MKSIHILVESSHDYKIGTIDVNNDELVQNSYGRPIRKWMLVLLSEESFPSNSFSVVLGSKENSEVFICVDPFLFLGG